MRTAVVWGAVAALGLTGPALAREEGLRYTFLELAYLYADFDDTGISGDGPGGRVSLELTEKIHLFGSYDEQDLDFGIGIESSKAGAGLAWPVNADMDVIGRIAYARRELDIPGVERFEDTGYSAEAAVRARVTEQAELEAGIDYTDFDEAGGDTSVQVQGRYFFTERFAAGGELLFNEAGLKVGIAFRYEFGD